MKLPELVSESFCIDTHLYLDQLIFHIQHCEQCKAGVWKLYNAFPIAGMFLPAKDLDSFLNHSQQKEQTDGNTESDKD